MNTLRRLLTPLPNIPTATAWYLADLGEAKGKQSLFTQQSPQKLKALREHALIESAVSSNRIEGVEVEPSRIGTVVFGKALLRDRDEEEVRGYRRALELIHSRGAKLPVTEETIRQLHSLSRGGLGDAGEYKRSENDIIEVFPSGRREIRFWTVRAADTAAAMRESIENWNAILHTRSVPPLIALGAFNLDFLCIHPFRDGNGRTSRLLFLLQCYHLGLEVGRYISLERLIEQHKERYYETLKLSSEGWSEDRHDPWHSINFSLYTLVDAYRAFESRYGESTAQKGEKTKWVLNAIRNIASPFRIADLRQACPGVSVDWIRQVLKDLRVAGQVECLGRGQNAKWQRMTDELGTTQ